MDFIKYIAEDFLHWFEFLMCRVRCKLFGFIKPYRFSKKPMKGTICTFIDLSHKNPSCVIEETAYYCTRCGYVQLKQSERCSNCGQKLEWR